MVEVADVHIAAEVPGREDRAIARLRRRDAHGTAERLERQHHAIDELGGLAVREVEVLEIRLVELLTEESHAGEDAGPAAIVRHKREDFDLECVSIRAILGLHRLTTPALPQPG
jgi:hypothetical protein